MNCGFLYGGCTGSCNLYVNGKYTTVSAYVGYIYCSDGSTQSISHCYC